MISHANMYILINIKSPDANTLEVQVIRESVAFWLKCDVAELKK